jgi:peptidoglycan/xylan/chitin deacetylase (PgdA/CDA1 family)
VTRPFSHLPFAGRPRLELPGGKRLAVWVAVNVEVYPPDRGPHVDAVTAGLAHDPLNDGWRDYGARVGIWRLIEVLDRHGLRSSCPIQSEAAELYPEIVAAGNERGWTWLAHGLRGGTLHTGLEEDEERAQLAHMVNTLERTTGRRPSGWLGPALTETPNTPRLLAELGFTHTCCWCNDDQPYHLDVPGIVSVPYSIEVNDILLLLTRGWTARDYGDALIDQFDALYEHAADTGLVMCIPLHPFLVGPPLVLKHLDRALAHIAGHDDLWLPTSDEIAEWFAATGPRA